MVDKQPQKEEEKEPGDLENQVEEITEDMDLDIIEKMNEASLRMEKANKRHEQLILKQMKTNTQARLGGRADTNIPEPPEESAADYAKKVMANEKIEEKTTEKPKP